jgi:hypothetical protein
MPDDAARGRGVDGFVTNVGGIVTNDEPRRGANVDGASGGASERDEAW